MKNIFTEHKRIIAIILVFILIVIAMVVIFTRQATATINITSNKDAKIFYKQSSSDFKEIGTGSASLKTSDKSQVFIEARLNGQVSQKSVKPEMNKTISVDLQFQPLKEAQYIAPGPLVYPFLEKGFMYGINPQTNGLAVFPLDGNNSKEPILPLLPYLKQVFWKDSKNFVYVTMGRGTGVVLNNKSLEDSYYNYISLAVGGGNNTILTDKSGFYYANKLDLDNVKKLSDFTSGSSPYVFADNNYLYAVSLIYNKAKEESDIPSGKETRFVLYSLDGNQKFDFTLPITDQTNKVIATNSENVAILSGNKITLYNLNTKTSKEQSFSFGDVEDMIIYKGRVVIMGTDGLWQFNTTTGEYFKIANYPEYQEYVPNSLTIINEDLIFSTSIKKEDIKKGKGPNFRSGIYKINF